MDIENFSETLLKKTDSAITGKLKPGEQPQIVELTLKFTIPDNPEFTSELERITNLYESDE